MSLLELIQAHSDDVKLNSQVVSDTTRAVGREIMTRRVNAKLGDLIGLIDSDFFFYKAGIFMNKDRLGHLSYFDFSTLKILRY